MKISESGQWINLKVINMKLQKRISGIKIAEVMYG